MVRRSYTIEIDSSERDPIAFPKSNDYTVKLNRPIYDVSAMTLVSASIPKTQNLINAGNKQFDITTTSGTTTKVLTEGTWTNGADFASNIQSQLANFDTLSNNITVAYTSNTNALTFTGTCDFSFKFYTGSNGFSVSSDVGTPAAVFGFSHADTPITSTLVAGTLDLSGPTSFILAISSGATELSRYLYTKDVETQMSLNSFYMGRILCGSANISEYVDFFNLDKPIVHNFYKGNEKSIEDLTVRFYHGNGNKLIKYDFGNRNHILKFEVDCSLDKLESQEIADAFLSKNIIELPPPIDFVSPNKNRFDFRQKTTIWVVLLFLVVGLVVLVGFNGQPRRPSPVV